MVYHNSNRYNMLINYTFILYALAMSISRAGIVFFTALLILFWLFEGDFKNKFKILTKNRVVIFILLFVVFSFISLIWSNVPKEGLVYVKKYWYFIPIFIMYTSFDKKNIKYVINSFLIGMAINEILSYGIFFELWQFKDRLPSYPTPFMNHLQYSMFLAFTALLLLNNFYTYTNKKIRFLYLLYFFFVLTNLFINGGRTGQVAFVVSIFVLLFIKIKNRIKLFIILPILLSIGLVVAYNSSINFQNRVNMAVKDLQKLSNSNYCGSFGLRVGSWIVATDIIKDNFIIGTGAADEMVALREYIDKNHKDKECVKAMVNFHNDSVHIFVQLGIIGLLLYLLIFYYIAKIKIKSNIYKSLPPVFVSVYFVSSMFENMIHQQFSMLLFALFVGIFLALSKEKS